MTPVASTAQIINDGQIQYGSYLATIKYSATPGTTRIDEYASTRGVYLFEDFTPTRATKLIRQYDEIGGPRGQVLLAAFNDATAVCQYNDAAQMAPQPGDVFELTVDATIGAEYWIVGNVITPKKQDEYWKANLTLHKAINPSVVPNFTPN